MPNKTAALLPKKRHLGNFLHRRYECNFLRLKTSGLPNQTSGLHVGWLSDGAEAEMMA
jgi:hypothetical protein